MNRLRQLSILAIVTIVVIIGIFILKSPSTKEASPPPITVPKTASVQITEDGFVPATLKIKPGEVVIWTNVDNQPHRVAANPYPSHSDLPALDSKTNIAPNGTYHFTFDEAGSFGYHDELNPKINATVVVQ